MTCAELPHLCCTGRAFSPSLLSSLLQGHWSLAPEPWHWLELAYNWQLWVFNAAQNKTAEAIKH